MSGKLFTRGLRSACSRRGAMLIGLGLTIVSMGGCRRERGVVLTKPGTVVDTAVRPEHFATGLRKLAPAHYRSVARFEASPDGVPMETVTTETDVWIDGQGNWRLVELNDKDGGREIVLHGRELSVALRYGKMIRRAAEDPEPQRLLEEGIGAPFAAWDLLRTVSTVDDFGTENRGGRNVHLYKLTKARNTTEGARATGDQDRRAWRRTVAADTLEGALVIDDATGVPLQVDFRAQYSMRRPAARGAPAGGSGGAGSEQAQGAATDPVPMHGAITVHATIENIGHSPAIARPEAEDLPMRQRTVPDEKALLSGLPRSAPPPPALPPTKGAGRSGGTKNKTAKGLTAR